VLECAWSDQSLSSWRRSEILCNNAGWEAAGWIDDDGDDDDDDGGAVARVNKMCTLIQNLET
jgi:hypothetical protein